MCDATGMSNAPDSRDRPPLWREVADVGMSLSLLKLVDRSLLGWDVMLRLCGVQDLK